MDVRTNSEYLAFLAERLNEFSRTFDEFMTHHVENSGVGAMAVGMLPAVLPKDGADKAPVGVLADELNRLAGALMDLSSIADVRLAVQGPGGRRPHTTDDAVPARRRAFTRTELQSFFDAADDLADTEFAKGSKRWLPALRASTAFKVAYACGLRRRELVMLEYVDFWSQPVR